MSVSYDASFYAAQAVSSMKSAREILPDLFARVQPRSVLDVGCGIGPWLRVAGDLGAQVLLGIDGDYVERRQLMIPLESFLPVDLAHPGLKDKVVALHPDRFDLVMCLEVAEHLPFERSTSLVDELCQLGDVVLFSAAIPFQGGTQHVNEQWPEFWALLFRSLGFVCYDWLRQQIWAAPNVDWWYAQNVLLFVREGSPVRADLPANAVVEREVLSRVHPHAWLSSLLTKVIVHRESAWQDEPEDLNTVLRAYRQGDRLPPVLRAVERARLAHPDAREVFPWTRLDSASLASIGRLDSQNKILSAENRSLDAELQRLRADNQSLDAELQRLRADNQSLDAELQRLRTNNQSLDAELQRARADKQSLDAELQRARADKQSLDAELQRARADNQSLDAELQRLRAGNQSLDAKLQRLRTGNQSLDAKLQRLRTDNRSLDTELQRLRADNQSLDIELQRLNRERKDSITELYRIDAERERLRLELAALSKPNVLRNAVTLLSRRYVQLHRVRHALGRLRYSVLGYVLTVSFRALKARSLVPLRHWRDARVIARSGRFDRRWYFENNPDVAAWRINPIHHYVEHGAAEGRNPNLSFDTQTYLSFNPDVAATGVNPFAHYLLFGAAEKRHPYG